MFFPTYKTQNKGFLGVLHEWDPPWGHLETNPFAQSERKWKVYFGGLNFKNDKIWGLGIFFSVTTIFYFWGVEWKKWKNLKIFVWSQP